MRAAPACTATLAGNQVLQDCTLNGRQISVSATFTSCPNDGICVEFQVANKSSEVLTEAMLSSLGISSATFNASNYGPFPVGNLNPAGLLDLVAVKAGVWIDTPATIFISRHSAGTLPYAKTNS